LLECLVTFALPFALLLLGVANGLTLAVNAIAAYFIGEADDATRTSTTFHLEATQSAPRALVMEIKIVSAAVAIFFVSHVPSHASAIVPLQNRSARRRHRQT